MNIPTTYTTALLLSIFTMICWGSWANTAKAAGKWRFELFYFDFSIGVLLCAIVACFSFGYLGSEITFVDNVTIVRYSQIGLSGLAGVVFNLGNILLVGAIAVAGISVAFPVGIGLALILGVVWSYFLRPQGHPALLFSGAAVVALAIIATSIAYREMLYMKDKEIRLQAAATNPKGVRPRKLPKWKGIVLGLAGGVLIGSFYPLVEMARIDFIEMNAYAIGFMFAVGVFASSFFFVPVLMNLPIQGDPLPFKTYLNGSLKQHLLGIFGGVIWFAGALASFVTAGAPEDAQVGPGVAYAVGQGATLMSTLWGLLYWKEFARAPPRSKSLIWAALLLYAIGLGLVASAPMLAKK